MSYAAKTPGIQQTTVSPSVAKDSKPQRKLRVLLTEDNLINQQLLQRQLMKAGCTVFVANNGKEALDFIVDNRSPLDCILMGKSSYVDYTNYQLRVMLQISRCP
jgi:response regulator RpfG family c-di-GMP phosphodiesterase